jgi:hypothetical protein
VYETTRHAWAIRGLSSYPAANPLTPDICKPIAYDKNVVAAKLRQLS